ISSSCEPWWLATCHRSFGAPLSPPFKEERDLLALAPPTQLAEQLLHGRAQPMHLIEKVQDHLDALVIDAEIVAQVADEAGAGKIDFGKREFRLGLRRNEPAGLNPRLQRLLLHADLQQKFLDGNHRSKPPACGADRSFVRLSSVWRIPRALRPAG